MSEAQVKRSIPLVGDAPTRADIVLSVQTLLKATKYLAYTVISLVVVVVALVGWNIHLQQDKPKPRIIGLTQDARVVPLHEIEGELFKSSNILAWAERKSELLYTFTFLTSKVDWPNSLSDFVSEKTKLAWIESLRKDSLIQDVQAKRAILYAQKDGRARLEKSAFDKSANMVVNVVEIPLTVVLDTGATSGERGRSFKVTMRLYIGQVGFDNAPDGLKIGRIELVK